MEPNTQPTNKSGKTAGIVLGTLVVVAIVLYMLFSHKAPEVSPTTDQASSTSDTSTQTPAGDTSTTTPADTTNTTAATSVYKDGTYSATGSYMSPGGPDKIGVTLTLKNDIITSVTATPEPGDSTSAKYQNKFMSGYQALVVGMNIDSVNLTKVSGSSLTPGGFDDALAQIKSQAAV